MNLPDGECNMFETPTKLDGTFEYRGDESVEILDKYLCISPEFFQSYRNWLSEVLRLAQQRCE